MRIPLFVTLLLLAAAAGLGWHDRQHLAAVRTAHAELVKQVAARGIRLDLANSAAGGRGVSRVRLDPEAEARRVTLGFLARAREMGPLRDNLYNDEATAKRVSEEMEQLEPLRGRQLVIFIDEVLKAEDIEDQMRRKLLAFALRKLGDDHPEQALSLLTDRPGLLALYRGNGTSGDLLVEGTTNLWAQLDPEAAINWFKRNKHKLDAGLIQTATAHLTVGLNAVDPLRALEFAQAEAPENPKDRMEYFFANNGEAPENRDACLAALRKWSAGIPNEAERNRVVANGIQSIAFGSSSRNSVDFMSASRWIDGANLSAAELGFLRDEQIDNLFKREDTGQWIEWLDAKLPPDIARDRAHRLFSEWTERDPLAAGKWLATATDSPAKHTAARAYAELVFPYDRGTAIQWALTLPAGDDRDQTLKRLHDVWPKDDPEGAAAFAQEHGIKK